MKVIIAFPCETATRTSVAVARHLAAQIWAAAELLGWRQHLHAAA